MTSSAAQLTAKLNQYEIKFAAGELDCYNPWQDIIVWEEGYDEESSDASSSSDVVYMLDGSRCDFDPQTREWVAAR